MSETVRPKMKVLFLCAGNSCRSQMAEGWTRHLWDGVIEPYTGLRLNRRAFWPIQSQTGHTTRRGFIRKPVYSAGIETHGLNLNAVRVMAEEGVDISSHRSKHLDELKNVDFDYVVTVCDRARETCPWFPGRATAIHRDFDDPPRLARDAATEDEALGHYRRVRDEIRAFVEAIPKTLSEGSEEQE